MKELVYNSLSGTFSRNGKAVGCIRADGYVSVGYKGKKWLGHRLAWHMHYGTPVVGVIDHINRDRADNRIANLRDVSCRDSIWNIGRRFEDNSIGIRWRENRWEAYLTVWSKQVYLGRFGTREEAVEARRLGEEKLWPKPCQ